MTSEQLPLGKLPPELMARLLRGLPAKDAIVGPALGEDAGVIVAPDGYIVVTSDPITFTADRIARQVVQVNANDVAAMGAEPRWFLATVLLPPRATALDASSLIEEIAGECARAKITLIGGHTEVTDAVTRVVVAGTMLGTVGRDRLVTSAGARPDDVLILTKPVAIEGTALLAREAADALRRQGLDPRELEEAVALLEAPGISVLPEALILCGQSLPRALHDVTEGGLATALRELANASSIGLRIERGLIPILPACARICAALQLDPLGLLGSGSLLAAIAPEDVSGSLDRLRAAGIGAVSIGVATAGSQLELLEPDGSSTPLPLFERDELARYFEIRG